MWRCFCTFQFHCLIPSILTSSNPSQYSVETQRQSVIGPKQINWNVAQSTEQNEILLCTTWDQLHGMTAYNWSLSDTDITTNAKQANYNAHERIQRNNWRHRLKFFNILNPYCQNLGFAALSIFLKSPYGWYFCLSIFAVSIPYIADISVLALHNLPNTYISRGTEL